ncbi:hypothetical protein JXA80_08825 [bacterium]|nr:hypothetical protein [candidate division CSSED10-310 bacterium]
MNTLYQNAHACVMDLAQSIGIGYVILALKQISDQQLLHIPFRHLNLLDDPILKMYDSVVREIEEILFDPDTGIHSESELRLILLRLLETVSEIPVPDPEEHPD